MAPALPPSVPNHLDKRGWAHFFSSKDEECPTEMIQVSNWGSSTITLEISNGTRRNYQRQRIYQRGDQRDVETIDLASQPKTRASVGAQDTPVARHFGRFLCTASDDGHSGNHWRRTVQAHRSGGWTRQKNRRRGAGWTEECKAVSLAGHLGLHLQQFVVSTLSEP